MRKKDECHICGHVFSQKDFEENKFVIEIQDIEDCNFNICNNCIKLLKSKVDEIEEDNYIEVLEDDDEKNTTPKEIKSFLDEWIIDQEEAKIVTATAVYNHFKRLKRLEKDENANKKLNIQKSNMVLIGPTGSGKTELVRALANYLNLPYTIEDVTNITTAGYVGRDVDNILLNLLQAADNDKEKAQKGIVFLDEFDKISSKIPSSSGSDVKDINGKGVQQALLKIIEGGIYEVKKDKTSSSTIKFDTSDVLFIVGGAFEGIDKIIDKRLKKANKSDKEVLLGFGSTPESKKEKPFNDLISYLKHEDLKEYGFISEILGRLPILTYLNELSSKTLTKILTEPKHAILKQYKELFLMDGIELEFTEEALYSVAKKAKERKIGARALRSIIEETLSKAMYEVPSDKTIKKVLVQDDLTCTYEREEQLKIELTK